VFLLRGSGEAAISAPVAFQITDSMRGNLAVFLRVVVNVDAAAGWRSSTAFKELFPTATIRMGVLTWQIGCIVALR